MDENVSDNSEVRFFYKQKRTSELSDTFSSIVAQESLHDHD